MWYNQKYIFRNGNRMKLQRKLHVGLAGCILTLTGWICAPLQAQQPAPESEAAAAADQTFQNGPLPQLAAKEVKAIVMAQVKAFLPPAEEGAVEIDRLDKDTILTATVGGQKYSAKVFRTFLVEPLSPDEFFGRSEDYYVRTTAPWKLKVGLVIPADTYLSGKGVSVNAYDADMIGAQDAAIARSEALCKEALDQLGPERDVKTAAIAKAHKAEMDSLTKQITQLNADAAQKEQARDQVRRQIAQRQATTPINNTTWQWSQSQGLTFTDGLDQTLQKLDQAVAAQKTLQATMADELTAAVGQPGAKETALRAVLQTHRSHILGGEAISEEEMRADYESALGEPLKPPPASGKPQPPTPAGVKPPIQVTPAPIQGT
jgi:hypothetical protein